MQPKEFADLGLYLVLQISLSIGTMIAREVWRAHPAVGQTLTIINRNLFPSMPTNGIDRIWLVMVVTNAIVAVTLACFIFRMREVPYGAD